jgi:hypothetical protein
MPTSTGLPVEKRRCPREETIGARGRSVRPLARCGRRGARN